MFSSSVLRQLLLLYSDDVRVQITQILVTHACVYELDTPSAPCRGHHLLRSNELIQCHLLHIQYILFTHTGGEGCISVGTVCSNQLLYIYSQQNITKYVRRAGVSFGTV